MANYNLIQGLSFSLTSACDFEDRAFVAQIIKTLLALPPPLRPQKFGTSEPLRQKISSEQELIDILAGSAGPKTGSRGVGLLFDARKLVGFQIDWEKSQRQQLPFVAGHIMFDVLNRDPGILSAWISVIRQLVEIVRPSYGEVRSMATRGWDTPWDLKLRLPDIPPISIYGREYIAFFGREKIETAPFARVEKVGECYWCVASEALTDGVPDPLRQQIRSHLGDESFMSDGRWRYTSGLAPELDRSNTVA